MSSRETQSAEALRRAEILTELGRHEEAQSMLEKALGTDAHNVELLVQLSFSVSRSGDDGRAAELAEAALAEEPEHVGALIARAHAARHSAEVALCLALTETALRLSPNRRDALVARYAALTTAFEAGGSTAALEGYALEARDVVARVAAVYPADPAGPFLRGQYSATFEDDPRSAARFTRDALTLAPEDSDVLATLAHLELAANDSSAATVHAKSALAAAPSDPHARSTLAAATRGEMRLAGIVWAIAGIFSGLAELSGLPYKPLVYGVIFLLGVVTWRNVAALRKTDVKRYRSEHPIRWGSWCAGLAALAGLVIAAALVPEGGSFPLANILGWAVFSCGWGAIAVFVWGRALLPGWLLPKRWGRPSTKVADPHLLLTGVALEIGGVVFLVAPLAMTGLPFVYKPVLAALLTAAIGRAVWVMFGVRRRGFAASRRVDQRWWRRWCANVLFLIGAEVALLVAPDGGAVRLEVLLVAAGLGGMFAALFGAAHRPSVAPKPDGEDRQVGAGRNRALSRRGVLTLVIGALTLLAIFTVIQNPLGHQPAPRPSAHRAVASSPPSLDVEELTAGPTETVTVRVSVSGGGAYDLYGARDGKPLDERGIPVAETAERRLIVDRLSIPAFGVTVRADSATGQAACTMLVDGKVVSEHVRTGGASCSRLG